MCGKCGFIPQISLLFFNPSNSETFKRVSTILVANHMILVKKTTLETISIKYLSFKLWKHGLADRSIITRRAFLSHLLNLRAVSLYLLSSHDAARCEVA